MKNYEIEIKSLLGSKENAECLKEKVLQSGGTLKSSHKQLNHYFTGGDFSLCKEQIASLFEGETREKFLHIIEVGKNFSVRTREADGKVLFVVKASVDDTTSSNGIQRMEFEEPVSKTLEELDQVLLSCGFSYQAKWSREREQYESPRATICLDKNAGYGYVAEFEKILQEGDDLGAAERELRDFMGELGAGELAQDRLERMFAFYNEHWPEYYGTDKIFTIE